MSLLAGRDSRICCTKWAAISWRRVRASARKVSAGISFEIDREYQRRWASVTRSFSPPATRARRVGLCGMTLNATASAELTRAALFEK